MGILDELKYEADRIKRQERAEYFNAARRIAFYRDELQPAILRTHDFLTELLEHIRVVKPAIHNPIPLAPQEQIRCRQIGHVLNLDKANEPSRVEVHFFNVARNVELLIKPLKAADEALLLLEELKQQVQQKVAHDPTGKTVGKLFRIERFSLAGSIKFSISPKREFVLMETTHFIGAQTDRLEISPVDMDDKCLDKLARYILHQGSHPMQEQLPPDQLRDIRKRIVDEHRRRKIEIEQQEEAAKSGLGRLLGKFKRKRD